MAGSAVPYNWPALKTEYVSGNISVKRLAEKHGIPLATVRQRAGVDGWSRAKTEYRARLEHKTTQKIAGLQAKALASEYKIADELSRVLRAALKDAKQFRRHIVTETEAGEKRVSERVFEKVDMRALGEAAKALKVVEEVKRSLRGVLTAYEERKLSLVEQ